MLGSGREVFMNEESTACPRPCGFPWFHTLASFLIGAVVGDLWGGGDWASFRNRKAEIVKVLAEQQAAWNRGDLDGFMASYWKSDSMTFCGGSELTKGWQPTYDRYAKKYQGEGKEMGTLTFDEVDILHADNEGACARGKYRLQFRDGKTASGRFTLILKRIDGRWNIIHDHTAADPQPSS